MALKTDVVGPSSIDARKRRLGVALRDTHTAVIEMARKHGLGLSETLGIAAAVTAMIADDYGCRDEAVELLERWIKMLRSGEPIRYKADGNA